MNLIEELQQEERDRLAELEVDESPSQPPRFDLPVQLETRGPTEQVTEDDRNQFPQWHQMLIWSKNTIHKQTTAAKMREIGLLDFAEKLEKCHTIYTVAQCTKCGTVKKFPNRCDLFCCAECQPRKSNDRRKAVEWWTRQINQPKHVVLTVVNLADMTSFHVNEVKKWFRALRRSKFARNWTGGFWNLEVTNEGRGWHIHIHALIDAKWIDARELSEAWQRHTNGLGRIVKVLDCRNKSYLKEVTKYAVKGPQLAAWSPEQIKTFVLTFDHVKTFGVFGNLYGKRTQFAEWFKAVRDAKPRCECGSCSVLYFSEAQFLERDFLPTQERPLPPPTFTQQHPELFGLHKPAFPR